MVESTIWEEPLEVRVTFLTLLFMKGPDHIVREPMRVLAKRCNLCSDKVENYEKVKAAIEVLLAPDKHTLDAQEFDGRRIEVRDDGIFVLNGKKYDEELRQFWSKVRRNQQQNERREARRRNGTGGPLPGESTADLAETPEQEDRHVTAHLPEHARNLPAAEEIRSDRETWDNEPPPENEPPFEP